ncbi:MAG TPA: MotA/TolQ/ExbB proton channel family protein [Solirubrobacteraceae bacterium]|jgi:biopolymer transport protein ExbB/TolQ|nr:MotA/TolQ/ExbB proton channel family protein [Solirubrobacteraceae bacterium]
MIPQANIEDILFHLANVLRVPVFVAAILALIFMLFELGSFVFELTNRRRRIGFRRLDQAGGAALEALRRDDRPTAMRALAGVASSGMMAETLAELTAQYGEPAAEDRMAKCLADFDLGSLRRLERTRLLVRFGPALGLMGTLIPLSPALAGLAKGDVTQLSDNLRVAFSVTVLGLLIGAVAFAISLVRDRFYAQDLSDLEYLVAALNPEQVTTAHVGDVAPPHAGHA